MLSESDFTSDPLTDTKSFQSKKVPPECLQPATLFRLCCLKQGSTAVEATFHFHEMHGYQSTRTNFNDEYCTPGRTKVWSPTELAIECARCKALNDTTRYTRIKKALDEHRTNIEAELRKAGKGIWPLPHVVMDKVLGKQQNTFDHYTRT